MGHSLGWESQDRRTAVAYQSRASMDVGYKIGV